MTDKPISEAQMRALRARTWATARKTSLNALIKEYRAAGIRSPWDPVFPATVTALEYLAELRTAATALVAKLDECRWEGSPDSIYYDDEVDALRAVLKGNDDA